MARILSEKAGSSWIKAYLHHTDQQISPDLFHIWTAISVISSVLRRNVWFKYNHFPMFPNLYIVLVAPAGKCAKSTAMRIGRQMFKGIPDFKNSPDSISRAKMIKEMSNHYRNGQSTLTVHSSEFASLLATSTMDMVVFLTDIFDAPEEWEHQTESGVSALIKAPCLTLLAGTTPDWIAKAMPLDTIGIGLTSRIIFVYQDEARKRLPFAKLSKVQEELHPVLQADLHHIATTLKGDYKFEGQENETEDNPRGTGAYLAYNNWYEERPDIKKLNDPRLAGYFERKPGHVVRVCMCLAASRRDELVITLEDFNDALALFEATEVLMPKVFANVGKNPLSHDYEQVFGAVMRSGPQGISIGELMSLFSHSVDRKQLGDVMEVLVVRGLVTVSAGRLYPVNVDFDKNDQASPQIDSLTQE